MNATSFASSNRDWLGATVAPAPRCRHRGSNFGWRVCAASAADWRPCWRGDNRAPNSKTGAWGYAGRDGRIDCSSGICVVVAGHSSCLKSEENPAASSITNRATQEEQNEEGRKVIAQEEARKSPGRRRIFKPPLPHHFHPAADKKQIAQQTVPIKVIQKAMTVLSITSHVTPGSMAKQTVPNLMRAIPSPLPHHRLIQERRLSLHWLNAPWIVELRIVDQSADRVCCHVLFRIRHK